MPPASNAAALILGSDARAASLLDAIDRLLEVGAVATGEATISVAGVDLIYLGLNLVLSSVETLQASAGRQAAAPPAAPDDDRPASAPRQGARPEDGEGSAARPAVAAPIAPRAGSAALQPRLDLEPDQVEQGLAKLVLTLVEFLRQLLERQAIRRMDGGRLSDEEVERMGVALLQLREKLWAMAAQFGLRPEELNLDLGPLGNLL